MIFLWVMTFVGISTNLLAMPQASASEISVTENGSGSINAATVSEATTKDVSSTNTTDIANTVDSDNATGDNTVADNAGENVVETGNASDTSTIENSVNTNIVATEACCSKSGTIVVVSGNGANTRNTTSTTNNKKDSTIIQNTAHITNTIQGNVSTGNNRAFGNNGNVSIHTGSITVKNGIRNVSINQNMVKTGNDSLGVMLLDVSGNGSDSKHSLFYFSDTQKHITVTNYADIFNNVVLNLNTGDNIASHNTGDVEISTGDISTTTEIENQANQTTVETDCKCKEKPEPSPTPKPVDKITPAPSSEKSGTGSTGGEVASVSSEKILPVTGLNWLVMAFIGNVMMLFLGMILRLRSGNSPSNTL